jgi:hypothetical protein
MTYSVSKLPKKILDVFDEKKITVQNNTGHTVWLECHNGINPTIQVQQWGIESGSWSNVTTPTKFVTFNFNARYKDTVYSIGKNIPMGCGYKLTLNKVDDITKLPIVTEFSI